MKLAVLLASKFESEAELELSEMRAEMLRRAAQLETEEVAGFGDLAAQLRDEAKTLGQRERGPAGERPAVREHAEATSQSFVTAHDGIGPVGQPDRNAGGFAAEELKRALFCLRAWRVCPRQESPSTRVLL